MLLTHSRVYQAGEDVFARQVLEIKSTSSNVIPDASQPNTSPTVMRVLRTQGLPKRISGLMLMREVIASMGGL